MSHLNKQKFQNNVSINSQAEPFTQDKSVVPWEKKRTDRVYYLFSDKKMADAAVEKIRSDDVIEGNVVKTVTSTEPKPERLTETDSLSMMHQCEIEALLKRGMKIGFLLGLIISVGVINFFELNFSGSIAMAVGLTILSVLFGAWISSKIGVTVPQNKLKEFNDQIDAGNVLVVVSVKPRLKSYLMSMVDHFYKQGILEKGTL